MAPETKRDQIHTELPASDLAFEFGIKEETGFLFDILLRLERGHVCSSFAGRVLAANLLQQTFEHSSLETLQDCPDDVQNGRHWMRHREIDNDLSAALMFLPSHLKLPRNIRCIDAVFTHVVVNLAKISLHNAALGKVKKLALPETLMLQCHARLLPAAEEILNILRALPDLGAALRSPLMAISAYRAGIVFLEDFIAAQSRQSEDSLNFLTRVMAAFARTNALVRSLMVQLALEMTKAGLRSFTDEIVRACLITLHQL